ncbi:MAG: type II secretion system minor pseudopilin GspJ [Steroidobacteraceae bacterium]|jgi:general secretion pathway protein J|nr:type II secretion system minor pseudopilin GspJ [Steroidobacteraceae bacterium]
MSALPARATERGFTLLELLVALFVTAVMFALGYGAITQALANRDAVRTQQQRLNDLQRTVRMLAQDFSQAAARPVRDVLGTGQEDAFRADPRTTTIVAFTRAGVGSLAGTPRPSLQRIEYLLENGTLVRQAWPVLDRTQTTVATRRVLARDLRTVRFRYMDQSRQWLDQWPPPGAPLQQPGKASRLRPLAVEISLETADFGTVTRLVEVPG